jgi:type III pantothenate kinase
MKRRILVVDIGNSSTAAGLYQGGRVTRHVRLDTALTNPSRVRALIRRATGGRAIDGAVVASVVPRVNTIWKISIAGTKCLWVHHRLHLGVAISYPHPGTIGADRLANACGAVHRYGDPVIVADFGTAMTFDVITKRDGYIGGIIAPGLPLMFSYLAEKTAQLPLIRPGRFRGRIGKSTRTAMQLGAKWGYRGMVREILVELLKDPALRGARLVATGGYAGWVVDGLKPRMIVDPSLTLYGLGRIYELNSRREASPTGSSGRT